MLQRFPGGIDKRRLLPEGRRPDACPAGSAACEARKEGGTVRPPGRRRRGGAAGAVQPRHDLVPPLGQPRRRARAARPPHHRPRPDDRRRRRRSVQAARWTRELLDELDLAGLRPGDRLAWPARRHPARPQRQHRGGRLRSPTGSPVVLAARHPDELTVAFHKADRGDRLYLDTARNGYAQTVVAPYSVRAAARRAGRDAGGVGRARRPGVPPGRLDDRDDARPASPSATTRGPTMHRHARSLGPRRERLVGPPVSRCAADTQRCRVVEDAGRACGAGRRARR